MSRNSEEKMLQQIADGVEKLTPEWKETLWTAPVTAADGSEWFLDSVDCRRRKAPVKRYVRAAVAACLVLCLVSALLFQQLPSASVFLDVNPSMSLKVNYRNRVTAVKACNEDAVKVIGDLDFRGADLDVALYAILGSMVQHGYLTEAKDTILVSVCSGNAGRARELKQEVSGMISRSLDHLITAGEVLSQELDQKEVDHAPKESGETPGKSAFVDGLEKKYPQLVSDQLEQMTVDEIVTFLTEENLDYSDYTEEPTEEKDDPDDEEDENDWDDDDDDDNDDDDDDDPDLEEDDD